MDVKYIFPVKKEWFDMIVSGEKKEEYRKISPFYNSRLGKYIGQDILVGLRNGYSSKSPCIILNVTVFTGPGCPDWGAIPGEKYYILYINRIVGGF